MRRGAFSLFFFIQFFRRLFALVLFLIVLLQTFKQHSQCKERGGGNYRAYPPNRSKVDEYENARRKNQRADYTAYDAQNLIHIIIIYFFAPQRKRIYYIYYKERGGRRNVDI